MGSTTVGDGCTPRVARFSVGGRTSSVASGWHDVAKIRDRLDLQGGGRDGYRRRYRCSNY